MIVLGELKYDSFVDVNGDSRINVQQNPSPFANVEFNLKLSSSAAFALTSSGISLLGVW
jgi:hypothetical protein